MVLRCSRRMTGALCFMCYLFHGLRVLGHASWWRAAAQWCSTGRPSAGMCWLQDHDLHEPLDQVLAGLSGAGVRLGTALQQPGLLAASAAWDPDALPALCILALASDAKCPTADADGLEISISS